MKNKSFIKKLLVLLVVLITCSPQMWASKKVYMVANAWNDDSNAEFWVHAWDGTSDHSIDRKMQLLSNESEIYSADVNDTNNKYIFVRRNKNDAGDGPWSGEWNRAEFTNNSYNCFHVKAFDDYEMNTNLTTATVYFASSNANVWVNVNRQVNSKSLWSLVKMTSTGKTYKGNTLYTGTFNIVWGGLGELQFKEGDDWGSKIINSSTITSSSTFDGKLYDGSSWVSYRYDHQVTFDGNGSTSGSMTPQTMPYNTATAIKANSFSKTGCTFIGWNTKADGSGDYYAGGANITVTDSDVKLYAQWATTGLYITGLFNSWHYPDSCVMTATDVANEVAVTLRFRAADFSPSFKTRIKVRDWRTTSGTWYSNNSRGESNAINKAGNNPTNLSSSDGNDMYLDLSISAGSYTFKYNYSTQVLTVVFPVNNRIDFFEPSTDYANMTLSASVYSVEKELTAGNTYTFKLEYLSDFFSDGSSFTATRTISNLTANSSSNMSLTPTRTGTYTFTYDPSTKNFTVTYPTSYSITVAKGTGISGVTGNVTYAAPSTNYPITATVKTGYTWSAWNVSGTGASTNTVVSSGNPVTANAVVTSANGTFTAVATEDMHDVAVEAGDNGSVDDDEVTVGIDTKSGNITATPDPGYYFTGWTLPDGVTAAAGFTSSSNPIQIKATADSKTITANFAPIWAVASTATDPDYDTGVNLIENISSAGDPAVYTGYKDIPLAANTDYEFQIVDRQGSTTWYGHVSGSGAKTEIGYADDNTAVNAATGSYNNFTLHTASAGTYRFYWSWNATTKQVKVDFPTSRQITIGQKSIYDPAVTNTSDATTTGGNVTAEDNSSNTITTGQYVADGANVTFTAHPATGYAFKGWYQNADCTTPYSEVPGVVIDAEAKTLTLSSIAADKAVYAKYEEIMTRISILTYGGKFSVDGGAPTETYHDPYLQVGVKTTHTVSIASEDAGHYFSNWELSASEDEAVNYSISGLAENEDNRSITVTGLGVETRTQLNFLEPKFKQLESIYFRNIFDDGETVTHWENVYVHFATQWADFRGQQAVKTSNDDCYANLHVQMEEIGTTHIFRAYVPRFVTRYTKTTVAFASSEDTYRDSYLYAGSACGRSDYNAKHNMFVPNHSKTRDVNGVAYYNSGYWMHYSITPGVDAGYWIERRTAENTYSGKPADQFVIVKRAYEDNPSIQYRLRIDNVGNDKYAIFSEGGLKYKAASTITHSACDGIEVVEDNSSDAYFVLTPTAEGEYIITLDQSGDKMKMSVEYPIVSGDYVLEHTYTGRNKANTADSTYTTRTNVIKASTAGTNTRYSMYLNKKDATLKLRKCESINASGEPQWSTGSTANVNFITDVLNEIGDGVYQFDLTVAADALATVDSVRLYTGNFYIKTDAASGGWVSYKNNILTKNTVNFDRADASTFDHYFCKYFSSKDCNIKSVIANDYCNQLSDTVKGDGIARMYNGEPYVPIDGTSIRFSYNSATNETKRAYLGASYHNGFLNIVPSTDNKVYRTISATKYDLYDDPTDSTKLKFDDNGNYVYEMDVTVKPGAKAGVRAVYNTSYTQMLIPSTNTLLGGTGSSEYSIRIVYDFKTNFMMSAFVLTDTPIEENLAYFDMLWVRHKDDSPTQLTLGDKKTLSNVRPIGAIEFRYDEMCSSSSSGDRVDLSSWSAASRPYLKYFISFPFDVHVGSVFGLNDAYYGLDYVIQKYDGATRAADGLFAGDGDNYWINLTQDSIMHANEGYCLILDNDYARWNGSSDMWYNKGAGSSAYIYFPAMDVITTIASGEEPSTKVPEHTCTINRWWANNKEKNHINTDSHWNMIGQPFFHDAYIKSSTNAADTIPDLGAYYYLDYVENKWYAQAFDKEHSTIKAMSCIYVQWAGDITWTTNSDNDKWKDTKPASPAAAPRRVKAEEGKNYLIQLDVELNGKVSDWTFVRLAEEANDDFILREDMFKMYNNGIPNIYTFAGGYDVAYNAVPVKSQIIPMGVLIRKNGTYKFSMPSDFSGTVTLIDQFAQTRTNLALDDYTVDLTKGTINDRFELEINVNNAPTAIDGVTDGSGSLKDGKAHKFIMNDMLYILKDGVLYDARGNRVK